MKKIIITLILSIITLSVSAQTIQYKTTELSLGEKTPYGIKWGPWEECAVPVSINWNDALIVIGSSTPQYYSITQVGQETKDKHGATCLTCRGKDLENRNCEIAFRIQTDGTSQLYVFYNDYCWVYNIVKNQ